MQGGRIRGDQTYYRFNDYLVEHLINPGVFAKILLQVQTKFTSKYSLTLYEYFIDALSRNRQEQTSEIFDLEAINQILDYEGAYKYLNNDVLKKSKKEIDKHTDITIDYTPTR